MYHFFDFIFLKKNSSEAVSDGPNGKFGQNMPSVQCKNTNFSQIGSSLNIRLTSPNTVFERFPHESPCGPPLPRGCNLVCRKLLNFFPQALTWFCLYVCMYQTYSWRSRTSVDCAFRCTWMLTMSTLESRIEAIHTNRRIIQKSANQI